MEAKFVLALGRKDSDILPTRSAKLMPVGGPSKALVGLSRFMNVEETSAIWREGESSQITTRQRVGQRRAASHVVKFELSGRLPAFLDFVEQQPAVRRYLKGLHRGKGSRSTFRRIDQQDVRAVGPVPHVDAGLFLPGKTLSEEIAAANPLQRIVCLDGEQFSYAVSNSPATGNRIEIRARMLRLSFNPLLRSC